MSWSVALTLLFPPTVVALTYWSVRARGPNRLLRGASALVIVAGLYVQITRLGGPTLRGEEDPPVERELAEPQPPPPDTTQTQRPEAPSPATTAAPPPPGTEVTLDARDGPDCFRLSVPPRSPVEVTRLGGRIYWFGRNEIGGAQLPPLMGNVFDSRGERLLYPNPQCRFHNVCLLMRYDSGRDIVVDWPRGQNTLTVWNYEPSPAQVCLDVNIKQAYLADRTGELRSDGRTFLSGSIRFRAAGGTPPQSPARREAEPRSQLPAVDAAPALRPGYYANRDSFLRFLPDGRFHLVLYKQPPLQDDSLDGSYEVAGNRVVYHVRATGYAREGWFDGDTIEFQGAWPFLWVPSRPTSPYQRPPLTEASRVAALEAMRADLRSLTAVQESFLRSRDRYAATTRELGADFRPSAGVGVMMAAATATAWSALAVHDDLLGVSCWIWHGAELAQEGQPEDEPYCLGGA